METLEIVILSIIVGLVVFTVCVNCYMFYLKLNRQRSIEGNPNGMSFFASSINT